ncbi:hypothetical protein KCP76_20750 [Salmonella enterica subsp. enterica serovar Weltevreden]|nr:hypothetical protein KCP76_20750 [Salmonella enterica subsp. enterica serovar Weltevreden]
MQRAGTINTRSAPRRRRRNYRVSGGEAAPHCRGGRFFNAQSSTLPPLIRHCEASHRGDHRINFAYP